MNELRDLNIAQLHNIAGPAFPERFLGDDAQVALIRQYIMDSGPIYVEMEYYADGTLESKLTSSSFVDLEPKAKIQQAVGWCFQIANTLSQIHQKGRCHGDLKFSNCLLKGDTVLLSDFGLSQDFIKSSFLADWGVGTPAYKAPELVSRTGTPSTRADSWALAVMLYRMLTNEFPFDGVDVDDNIKIVKFTDPNDLNPEIDEQLVKLIDGCFQLKPGDRMPADQIAKKLLDWLDERGLSGSIPKFAWNPELVKDVVKSEFVFLLLKLTAFGPNTYNRLSQILRRHGCGIFRLYRTLGHYDVIIRTFISNSALDRLIAAVRDTDKETRPIATVIPHRVSQTFTHWHWDNHPLVREELLDPAALVELESFLTQGNWPKLAVMADAIKNGLIRPVKVLENIIFFVFVSETKLIQNRQAIIEIIQHSIEAEVKNKTISHQSIYEIGSGATLAIVKGEVTDYFKIGEIVKRLGEKLAASDCTTLTCMAADKEVEGNEELGAAEFTVRATTKLLRDLLPELPEYHDETWETLTRKDAVSFEKLRDIEKILCEHIIEHGQRHFNDAKEWIEQLFAKRLFGEPLLDLIYQRLGEIAVQVRQVASNIGLNLGTPPKGLSELLAEVVAYLNPQNDATFPVGKEFPEVKPLVNKLQNSILDQQDRGEELELMTQILSLDAKVWTIQSLHRPAE